MDEVAPNVSAPQVPAGPTGQIDPAEQVPQNLDKSDAMTYPIGSQNPQSGTDPTQPAEEDHQSILDKIMGIFSKGKKPEQPQEAQPASIDQTPTNTTPPPGQ